MNSPVTKWGLEDMTLFKRMTVAKGVREATEGSSGREHSKESTTASQQREKEPVFGSLAWQGPLRVRGHCNVL